MKHKYCVAPVTGRIVPLEQVKDPVFSSKTLGDGVAIKPAENLVCAPVDGILKLMFHTGHAFVIENAHGEEVMVHIGIDTVRYQGRGFWPLKSQGNQVKKGEPVVRFEQEYLEQADMTTMVVLLSAQQEEQIKKTGCQDCRGGADVIMEW